MYEKFYGFNEKPFNTTPDSKFFFPSDKHTEALNSLIYAIDERKGFVVITGEIGAGKTTVCKTLINKLDSRTKLAIITNTHLTCKELIAQVYLVLVNAVPRRRDQPFSLFKIPLVQGFAGLTLGL